MSYHEAQRAPQDRFATRRLADRLAEGTSQTISPQHKRFIEDREMFFLATSDSAGWPECSYKGGDKGFVRDIDESTITFPVYDGNGMFLSCGNLMVNPRVGMLFVEAPVPDWKLDPWFDGTLPASDPANDPSCPTAEAIPRF